MKNILLILLLLPFFAKSQISDLNKAITASKGFNLRSQTQSAVPAYNLRILYFDTDSNRLVLKTGASTYRGLAFNGEGGGGGGGTWGSITGTLSAQTDLQTALNLKVNISDTAAMLANYWRKGGNSFGANSIVGSLDNFSVDQYTNGAQRARWLNTGALVIGGTALPGAFGTPRLQVTGGHSSFGDQVFVNTTPFSTPEFFYVTGAARVTTTARIGDLQLLTANLTASTTGYGIATGNTTSSFFFQGTPGFANQTIFRFGYYFGTTGNLGGSANSVSRGVSIQTGWANAGNNNQIANTLEVIPVLNQAAAFTGIKYRDVYLNATETSLTGTAHTSILQITGSNYFNVAGGTGNFSIGLDSLATIGAKLHVNGTVRLDGMLIGTSTSPILVKDADSIIRQVPQSSLTGVSNIYNNDGTISANRTVTGAARTLTFTGFSAFNIFSTDLTFAKTDGTFKYTGRIVGSDNSLQFGYLKGGSLGAALLIDTNNNFITGGATSISLPLYTTGNAFVATGMQSLGGNFYRVNSFTTGTVSVLLTYYFIQADATGGNITFNLPAASTAFGAGVGIKYIFKRLDATGNTITISRSSTDLIDGATSFTLGAQYDAKTIICSSASTWSIIP